jgi:hypothetical protein
VELWNVNVVANVFGCVYLISANVYFTVILVRKTKRVILFKNRKISVIREDLYSQSISITDSIFAIKLPFTGMDH